MAHKTLDTDLAYHRLQQRLDRMVTGARLLPALQAILRLLFTPEEAELPARMPTTCSLHSLAERVGRDEAALDALVTSMARRGLVVDLEHRGERWVMLAPVVIGFFEYTFMRVRTGAPMEQLHAADDTGPDPLSWTSVMSSRSRETRWWAPEPPPAARRER